jgi:hypothetical protein
MDAEVSFTCPVCGYPGLREEPRSPAKGASYEICPSCGFQFGFDDEDQGISDEQWRKRWLDSGMPWTSVGKYPPPGWDPREQLKRLFDQET